MPELGWYDDPSDSKAIRYFDGESWTERTKPKPGTPFGEPVQSAGSPNKGFDRRRLLFGVPAVLGLVLLAVGLSSLRSSGEIGDRVSGPSKFSDVDTECGEPAEDTFEIDLDNDGRLERIEKTSNNGDFQFWQAVAHQGDCAWFPLITLTSSQGEPVASGDSGVPTIYDWCVNTSGQQPVILEMYQEQENQGEPVYIYDHYFQYGQVQTGNLNQIDNRDIGELVYDCPTVFSGE